MYQTYTAPLKVGYKASITYIHVAQDKRGYPDNYEYFFLRISLQKHTLWALIRIASSRRF